MAVNTFERTTAFRIHLGVTTIIILVLYPNGWVRQIKNAICSCILCVLIVSINSYIGVWNVARNEQKYWWWRKIDAK